MIHAERKAVRGEEGYKQEGKMEIKNLTPKDLDSEEKIVFFMYGL